MLNQQVTFINTWRPGEAPSGYPFQVLAQPHRINASLWAFHFYPWPECYRNVHTRLSKL